jgi:VWFA-related protein
VSLFCAVVLLCLTVAGALSQTTPQSAPAQAPLPIPAPPPTSTAPPIDKNAPEMTTKDAPAIFKTRVDMVSVPVVVRDNRGHTIGTYTKENFQVFDKGKPQEILRFVVEKSGEQAAKAAKTVDTLPVEGDAAQTNRQPDVPERFVAYLFDDMHLTWEDLARARDAAGRQLATMPKTDRAAIYTTSGQNNVEFTDDVDKLQADLLLLRNRSISNMGGIKQCPDISYYMADLILNKNDTQTLNLAAQEAMACLGLPTLQAAMGTAQGMAQQVLAVGQQETHVTYTVFKDVLRRMSSMPGQRIVVLVSPGFISPNEYQPDKNDIIDHAIKANVVINSLDARGLWTDPTIDASQQSSYTVQYQIAKQMNDRLAASTQADVLAEMAYGTGGTIFQNNNDLNAGFRQLAAAPEYYYVLGFAPQNLKFDGTFHALKVTLKTNPPVSLDIQARKGYYAPKKASSAEETAKQEIEEALFSRDELSDLPVELHTQYFKAGEKDATIAVLCRMDPRHIPFRKGDGRNSNVLTVVSAVFDHNGNFLSAIVKTVELKLKDETLAKLMTAGVMTLKTNFSVPPGSYMIRLVVRDSEGQLMSALNGAVAIQ